MLLAHSTAEQVVIIFTHDVRPSVRHKTKNFFYNTSIAARKTKHAPRRTSCMNIMTFYCMAGAWWILLNSPDLYVCLNFRDTFLLLTTNTALLEKTSFNINNRIITFAKHSHAGQNLSSLNGESPVIYNLEISFSRLFSITITLACSQLSMSYNFSLKQITGWP